MHGKLKICLKFHQRSQLIATAVIQLHHLVNIEHQPHTCRCKFSLSIFAPATIRFDNLNVSTFLKLVKHVSVYFTTEQKRNKD